MRKRNLSLELYILAMIDAGITTPYSLKAEAGLSVGASIPALRRLEKDQLVKHAEAGRRHEYTLTPGGRDRLNTKWRTELEGHTPTDLDDVLRTASLLSVLAGRRDTMRFLQAAERARRLTAQQRRLEGERLLAQFGKNPAVAYRWMKTLAERARATAEAATLRTVARRLSTVAR